MPRLSLRKRPIRRLAASGQGSLFDHGCAPATPHDEMLPGLSAEVRAFYASLAQKLMGDGRLNDGWKRFQISGYDATASSPAGIWTVPAKHALDGAWWLSSSAHVTASGTFEMRVVDGKVYIRNINIIYAWHDEIDANSYVELWSKTDSWVYWFLEGSFDIYADKLLNADYQIRILFDHIAKEPYQTPIFPIP